MRSRDQAQPLVSGISSKPRAPPSMLLSSLQSSGEFRAGGVVAAAANVRKGPSDCMGAGPGSECRAGPRCWRSRGCWRRSSSSGSAARSGTGVAGGDSDGGGSAVTLAAVVMEGPEASAMMLAAAANVGAKTSFMPATRRDRSRRPDTEPDRLRADREV